MDKVMEYLSAHPAILTALVIFVAIMILYFVLKQFIKLALIILIIAIAAGGYYYFQDPHKLSEKVRKTIDTVKSGSSQVVEKSKGMYKDSKELIGKAAEVPGDVNKLLKGSDDEEKK